MSYLFRYTSCSHVVRDFSLSTDMKTKCCSRFNVYLTVPFNSKGNYIRSIFQGSWFLHLFHIISSKLKWKRVSPKNG